MPSLITTEEAVTQLLNTKLASKKGAERISALKEIISTLNNITESYENTLRSEENISKD